MSALFQLVRRDIVQAWQAGGIILPIIFFLLVATLFPFAIGPDAAVLGRIGGGVLWVAALLAALLPIDRLIAPDRDSGVLDQIALRGIPDEITMLARIIAHWLTFGPPLMLAALPASALLRIDAEALALIELGLLIGTPGLAALAVMISAITAGLRSAAALSGLLMLPLAIPLIIFGAGALGDGSGSALKLLAATSLLLCAIAPFAAGAAIRAGREA